MKRTTLFRKIVLSFEQVTEEPHFQKTSFRFRKKIFATLEDSKPIACVKLSLIDQSVYSSISPNIIFPVDNKWGTQGWTYIHLDKIDVAILKDITESAYLEVSQKNK